ncbi:hypothetical protein K7X08_003978 [Anisodus acutangulus]|uniref:Uncharacterized protein n=1 Tax=Anisodus acutangulus TaxID=402998 RepID=A0A9Q1RJW5_9SOLA|nr:hypothetical protein K7X08_003978 [Anisodus acutangulus]
MSYDVNDLEGQLQSEEGFTDVNVIQEDNDSDATSEDCESFHDSDYHVEEDNMILDQINKSITESVLIKGKAKANQVCGTKKSINFGVVSNVHAEFPNHTQEDDFVSSGKELMCLQGDSDDDDNPKRFII